MGRKPIPLESEKQSRSSCAVIRSKREAGAVKMPTTEQIDIALMWLESNEGEGTEGEACKAVAAWIDHMNREAWIRHEARARGVTIARFRAVLRNHPWNKEQ